MIPRPDNFIQIFLSLPRELCGNDSDYSYFYDDECPAIQGIRFDHVKHEETNFSSSPSLPTRYVTAVSAALGSIYVSRSIIKIRPKHRNVSGIIGVDELEWKHKNSFTSDDINLVGIECKIWCFLRLSRRNLAPMKRKAKTTTISWNGI